MKKERIGLFGGTFAPPHLGHVHVVTTVLEAISLDSLLIMPTAIPPHKAKAKGDTPEQRLAMCEAAFSDLDKVKVSSYEIDKGGLSYTVETLQYLTQKNREIYLICGGDMFQSLPQWYQAERIFQLATIVCVPRCREEYKILKQRKREYTRTYMAKIKLIGSNPLEMSSTEIREKIRRGESLTGILPEKVIEIIKNEKLYQGDTEQ